MCKCKTTRPHKHLRSKSLLNAAQFLTNQFKPYLRSLWKNHLHGMSISDSRGSTRESISKSIQLINIKEENLVDGRTIRSRIERETLVFMIFVCLFSKCSFITGFEVNIKSRLLHTDIQFFDPWYNPELPTTLQNVDYTFQKKLQEQKSTKEFIRLFLLMQ